MTFNRSEEAQGAANRQCVRAKEMTVCVRVCVCVWDCVVTADVYRVRARDCPPLSVLDPQLSRWHPLPATSRGIHGHGLSGKHLHNVFAKAYLQVHWQRNGLRRCGVYIYIWTSQVALVVKNPPANAGD